MERRHRCEACAHELPSIPAPSAWLRLLASAALLIAVAGCSLVSFKSPERPLSPRDLNARILTRELSTQFVTAVSRCADDMAASERDPMVLDHALRWEIAAVGESRRAATRMAPMLSLIDTWAFAAQLQAFTAEGAPGGALFGAHQQAVRDISGNYADQSQALARRLIAPHDFLAYQSFVEKYVREHPLADLTLARASAIELWSREQGADGKLVDSLGTVPEALADAADRLEIYGDTLPTQMMRRTQLALRESGYGHADVQAALRQLDQRLERLTAVAESTPELVHGAEAELRQALRELLERLEASERDADQALHTEREALFADLLRERAAVMTALDAERQAIAADAARISHSVVQDAGTQLRELAAEVLLLLIVLAVLVLGLPFGAGYLVGRARGDRARNP
jgi:hypothetical protein